MIDAILENVMVVLPLVLLQLGLMIFCIRKIVKEGVRNLNKPVWILIVVIVNLVGPLVFLFVGRRGDDYDSGE